MKNPFDEADLLAMHSIRNEFFDFIENWTEKISKTELLDAIKKETILISTGIEFVAFLRSILIEKPKQLELFEKVAKGIEIEDLGGFFESNK